MDCSSSPSPLPKGRGPGRGVRLLETSLIQWQCGRRERSSPVRGGGIKMHPVYFLSQNALSIIPEVCHNPWPERTFMNIAIKSLLLTTFAAAATAFAADAPLPAAPAAAPAA